MEVVFGFSLTMLLVSHWGFSCMATVVVHVPGMDGGVMLLLRCRAWLQLGLCFVFLGFGVQFVVG